MALPKPPHRGPPARLVPAPDAGEVAVSEPRAIAVAGEHRFASPPAAVWTALSDLSTVRASLPGCDQLERQPGGSISGRLAWDLAGLAGPSDLSASVVAIDPPQLARLNGVLGDGDGSVLCGSIEIALVPAEAGSRLLYRVEATVGERWADLPPGTVEDGLGLQIETFLANLAGSIAPVPMAAGSGDDIAGHAVLDGGPPARSGLPPLIWVPLLIAVVGLLTLATTLGG